MLSPNLKMPSNTLLNQQTRLDNESCDKRLTILVEYTHLLSVPRSRDSEYQLHRFAKKRTRKKVMTYNNCNCTLCINCKYFFYFTKVDSKQILFLMRRKK